QPSPSTERTFLPITTPPHPNSILFPYTTLFRSIQNPQSVSHGSAQENMADGISPKTSNRASAADNGRASNNGVSVPRAVDKSLRSEEHTSELQSRFDIVCRLLLEKKKKRRA